jgi:hypothetical protein
MATLIHPTIGPDPRVEELSRLLQNPLAIDFSSGVPNSFARQIAYTSTTMNIEAGVGMRLNGATSGMRIASNLGFTASDKVVIICGVTTFSASDQGLWFSLGAGGVGGWGIGVGNTDGDSLGNNLVGVVNAVLWQNTTVALGVQFNVVTYIHRPGDNFLLLNGDPTVLGYAAVASSNPDAQTDIGGHTESSGPYPRFPKGILHFAIAGAPVSQDASWDSTSDIAPAIRSLFLRTSSASNLAPRQWSRWAPDRGRMFVGRSIAPSFQAAWARNSNVVLQPGVAHAT